VQVFLKEQCGSQLAYMRAADGDGRGDSVL
jgi:hypothetical protein